MSQLGYSRPASSLFKLVPWVMWAHKILSLAGASTSIIFVATIFLVMTHTCLSRQNTCLLQQNMSFVTTKVCCSFVMAKLCLSRQNIFVATNITLSWQTFCILLSWQKMCFVMTNVCLSQQKWYLWQLPPKIRHMPDVTAVSATQVIECRQYHYPLLTTKCKSQTHGRLKSILI